MALTMAELDAMTRDDLVRRFDRLNSGGSVEYGAGFWREEIFRRDFDEQNATLIRMTAHIRWLTALVAVLTVVVTVATVVGLRK